MSYRLASFCLGIVLAVSQFAGAEPLPPGGVLFGPSEYAEWNGVGVDGYSWDGLNVFVIANEPENPFDGLTFVYQLWNGDSSSPRSTIGRFSVPGLAGFQIEAGYVQPFPTVGIAPAIIDRDPSGDVVGFDYLPLNGFPQTGFLDAGMTSAWMAIYTDAKAYKLGRVFALDNGTRAYQTFVPVPEPASLVLLAIGLGAMAATRRRR